MFRRRWSGLPADPVFPESLAELGYMVVNDEIRSIENPDYYFKYFLYKNERWNERQRFAFNAAISRLIHTRLATTHNLLTVPLPLGTSTAFAHVPILISSNLQAASRVVFFFGESAQELGVLAHRVIGRAGGISKGSVISLVSGLRSQRSSATDASPPGIVLANCGELWWWPEGGRGLTPLGRHRVPMASSVMYGRFHEKQRNEIEGNRNVREHVKCVFESVLMGGLVGDEVKVDVIAVGDAADEVEGYLNDEEVWGKVGDMMGCMVLLGGLYNSADFKCAGFAKFMEERARAYIIHHAPLDTPIAGSGGNPGVSGFTSFGCPVYSAGPDANLTELMMIETQPSVLNWMQQVAMEGVAYKNDVIEIYGDDVDEVDDTWGEYQSMPIEENGKGEAKTEDNPATEGTKDDKKDKTGVPDQTPETKGVESLANDAEDLKINI